jgi:hypothetical protein
MLFMKGKQTQWESEINGKQYSFTYELVKRKHMLTVNGNQIPIKPSLMSNFVSFDEGFELDGKEARFVLKGKSCDVAVDGVFLISKKEYVKRPTWVMGFVIANVLIPIVSLGGAIPLVLGFGGATICVNVSKTAMPITARALLCVGITVAAWLMLVLLIEVTAGIF